MDYAENIAFLANTLAKDESPLNSLELAAGSSCLHVNADKTEIICFNQRDDISTLNGRSLKLVDKFTSEAASHLRKMTSIRDKRRHGQLLIGYRSYGNQNYSIE